MQQNLAYLALVNARLTTQGWDNLYLTWPMCETRAERARHVANCSARAFIYHHITYTYAISHQNNSTQIYTI